MKNDFREKLADLCHSQWSGWMEYLFSKCDLQKDGTVFMPRWAVNRWSRQLGSTYADLTEEEKESDRKEADRFLKLFNEHNKANAIPVVKFSLYHRGDIVNFMFEGIMSLINEYIGKVVKINKYGDKYSYNIKVGAETYEIQEDYIITKYREEK